MKLNQYIHELMDLGVKKENIKVWKKHTCSDCSKEFQEYIYLSEAMKHSNPHFKLNVLQDHYMYDGDAMMITFDVEEDKKCYNCTNTNYVKSISYKEDYANAEWRNSCFHHGVAAFYTSEDTEEDIDRINNINQCDDMQICCSTEPIGMFGITCSGEVLLASDEDLGSKIDEDTFDRLVDERHLSRVTDVNKIYEETYEDEENNEIIIRKTVIEAIWYKKGICNEAKERLEKMAKDLKCFFYEMPYSDCE